MPGTFPRAAHNPSLILRWIPIGYIFETDLISTLANTFLPVPEFRNLSLQCLSEIATLQRPDFATQIVNLITCVLTQLQTIIPVGVDLAVVFGSLIPLIPSSLLRVFQCSLLQYFLTDYFFSGTASDDEQKLIQNLAIFLSSYLRTHGALLERSQEGLKILELALEYMLLISTVDENEIFKICLEYWNTLTSSLYQECTLGVGIPGHGIHGYGFNTSPHVLQYKKALSR